LISVAKDIASGFKEDRKRFWKLAEMAEEREFDILLVAYRNRLTRFRFKYLEELFKAYGAKAVMAFRERPRDFYQKLAEDLIESNFPLTRIYVYGKRNHNC